MCVCVMGGYGWERRGGGVTGRSPEWTVSVCS